jgi:hypothetical protein
MNPDNLLYQRQPETGAVTAAAARIVHAVKPVKNFAQRFLRYADAGGYAVVYCLGPQDDITPLGKILDPVGEQIVEYLAQTVLIAGECTAAPRPTRVV